MSKCLPCGGRDLAGGAGQGAGGPALDPGPLSRTRVSAQSRDLGRPNPFPGQPSLWQARAVLLRLLNQDLPRSSPGDGLGPSPPAPCRNASANRANRQERGTGEGNVHRSLATSARTGTSCRIGPDRASLIKKRVWHAKMQANSGQLSGLPERCRDQLLICGEPPLSGNSGGRLARFPVTPGHALRLTVPPAVPLHWHHRFGTTLEARSTHRATGGMPRPGTPNTHGPE